MDGYSTRVPFVSGSDYPDELHVLLKNEVMIRRLKANVVDQLPPLRLEYLRPSPCRCFFWLDGSTRKGTSIATISLCRSGLVPSYYSGTASLSSSYAPHLACTPS